jgi:hypothetical protein
VDNKSERDELGIFDDIQQVEAEPIAIGAVASILTLVALGVLFVLSVVFVVMKVVSPWVWMFLNLGPRR